MNRQLKPFYGHPVRSVSHNPSGDSFLCCCGNNQAKVYGFDGVKKRSTIRGDMYILDMSNTRGHVAAINDGKWHPKLENLFIIES